MQRARIIALAALIAALSLALGGCSEEAVTPSPTVVLTNVPDVAFAIELYNLDHEAAVEVRFAPNLSEILTQEASGADLVIGRWIRTPEVRALMTPIADYRAAAGAPTRTRNPGVALPLPESLTATHPRFVPLSYSLPVIAFRTSRAELRTDRTVTFAALGTDLVPRAASAGARPAGELRPMRFVPPYDPRGLYSIARSLGLAINLTSDGRPLVPRQQYTEVVAAIADWRTDYNGGPEAEAAYTERYLYEQRERLLDTGRLLAAWYTTETLFDWEFFAGGETDFRVVATADGEVLAEEDVVYAGIPIESDGVSQAVSIILWLLSEDVQVRMVAEKLERGIDTFGAFGGFSTNHRVNERLLREIYPTLAGRIPEVQAVTFPGVRPRYWDEARDAVVERALVAGESAEVLAGRLGRWYLQRGD